jgi:hypothetical protein
MKTMVRALTAVMAFGLSIGGQAAAQVFDRLERMNRDADDVCGTRCLDVIAHSLRCYAPRHDTYARCATLLVKNTKFLNRPKESATSAPRNENL